MHQPRGTERRHRRPTHGILLPARGHRPPPLLPFRFPSRFLFLVLLLRLGPFPELATATARAAATPPAAPVEARTERLRLSVYATAGDVLRFLDAPSEFPRTLDRLRALQVDRVFLEGRRGDEYVPPDRLARARTTLEAAGIRCSGGIATVPGTTFGTRQNEALGWLNWESPKTRRDVAGFFHENAPIFDELIVDDFYCTADTSAESDAARGTRDWGAYRRDLLVSSLDPLVFEPTRSARATTRLILKFPQWYDRFHRFGYDPARMATGFDHIWVGTEVRNPLTRRMGFVQPTEGFVNFAWIRSIAGPKTRGAWFDHIECTPQNFLDQAYLSVLAGARELTLFRLGDLIDGHPGDALLAQHLPALRVLAENVRTHQRIGIACYKPPVSDPADNLYLMDYLAFLGLPVLPVANFPDSAPVLFLGAQAAADDRIADRLQHAIDAGKVVILTPAFLRAAPASCRDLAGVTVDPQPREAHTAEVRIRRRPLPLPRPLEVDGSLRVTTARAPIEDVQGLPILTESRHRRARVLVLNVRTFSEQNFKDAGEWLLAPQPLGWSELPTALANALRQTVLAGTGLRFEAPAGVAFVPFQRAACVYNFRAEPVSVRIGRHRAQLQPHACLWLDP